MKNKESVLEKHLNDDRRIILVGIGVVSLVAWIHLAGMSDNLSIHSVTIKSIPWQISHLISYFIMWMIMMIAMMLPTAAPMILTFAAISQKRKSQQQSYVKTSFFVIGYLTVSVGYSAGIALFQWWLHNNALVTPLGVSVSNLLSGVLLVGAGLYQWSRLKYA